MSQRYIKRYIANIPRYIPYSLSLEVYFQILLKNTIYPTVLCPKGILVTTGLRYIRRYIRYLKPRTFLLEKKGKRREKTE